MPIRVSVLNQQLAHVGRLLTEWSRTGKKVPEGFKGTLRDYAWLHASVSTAEEIYFPSHSDEVRPGACFESDEPSSDDLLLDSLRLQASHTWDSDRMEWIPYENDHS